MIHIPYQLKKQPARPWVILQPAPSMDNFGARMTSSLFIRPETTQSRTDLGMDDPKGTHPSITQQMSHPACFDITTTAKMPSATSDNSYTFSFTAASLRPELLLIVAEQFLQSGSWKIAKERVLATNGLQCRTATSAQRLERELRPRVQTLSGHQLELLVESSADARISLAWLAAVKHSSFLYDFAAECLRSKIEQHDFVLRESDYRRFIEEKTPSHPELVKLSDSTSGKIRRVLFAMLREVGILLKGDEIGSLQRPVIPRQVELAIRDDNPEWLAAFLVPEGEIGTP